MDDDDDPLTIDDLEEELRDLERTLRETRRRADDREAQYQALSTAASLAEMKLPSGLGEAIDRALIRPKAAATLLVRSLQRAQKNVPTLPQDLDHLIAAIDRLLSFLPPVHKELLWVRGLAEK